LYNYLISINLIISSYNIVQGRITLKKNYKIKLLLIIILFFILIISFTFVEPEINEINKVISNNDLNFK